MNFWHQHFRHYVLEDDCGRLGWVCWRRKKGLWQAYVFLGREFLYRHFDRREEAQTWVLTQSIEWILAEPDLPATSL